jgi:hypothetical protein
MRSSVVGGFVLGLGLFAAGCNCGGGGVGDACDTNSDCDPGLVCDPLRNTCQLPSADAATDSGGGTSSDSGGGTSTDSGGGSSADSGGGTTTDSGPAALGDTGAACTAPGDCADTPSPGDAPLCIPDAFGFPGGYCTNTDCDIGLQDCPGSDAMCITGDMGGNLCVDICLTDTDCRPGYNCFDLGLLAGTPGSGPLACLPLCADDTDCDPGQMCDTTAFTCFTPGASVGDACDLPADCPTGSFCITEPLLGFPGGYCSADCDPSGPGGGTCPSGGTCYETDPMDPTAGTCLLDCTAGPGGGTCARAGYSCSDQLPFGGMLTSPACVPDCMSDSDCTVAGNTCEQIVGLCQPTPTNFGGPCDDASQCVGGLCLDELSSGAPFGNCVDECDPAGAATDCPSGGTCIDFSAFAGTSFGLCFQACDPLMPACRVGYDCTMNAIFPGGPACFADCDSSMQCEFGCCQTGFGGGNCVDPMPMTGPPPMCI